MVRIPEIVTLAGFRKTQGVLKKPTLIYFDAKQWANLVGDLEPAKGTLPAHTLRLALVEVPGLEGGFAAPSCPPECSGPIRGAEGEVRCACPPDVHVPPPPGGGSASGEFCAALFRSNGKVTCVGRCAKAGRTCRPRLVNVPSRPGGTRIAVLTCACR